MAKMSDHRINFGPPIPIVPVTHFVRDGRVSLEDAWKLVGPTIDYNLRHVNAADMWKLYAIAFLEGMRMTLHVQNDKEQN